MTAPATTRTRCVRDGLECSGNEYGRHVGFDPDDMDPADYPTECGDCDGNPRAEYAAFLIDGTCTHDYCADAAYYAWYFAPMLRNRETRVEREERLADVELMRDEFHGRLD